MCDSTIFLGRLIALSPIIVSWLVYQISSASVLANEAKIEKEGCLTWLAMPVALMSIYHLIFPAILSLIFPGSGNVVYLIGEVFLDGGQHNENVMAEYYRFVSQNLNYVFLYFGVLTFLCGLIAYKEGSRIKKRILKSLQNNERDYADSLNPTSLL